MSKITDTFPTQGSPSSTRLVRRKHLERKRARMQYPGAVHTSGTISQQIVRLMKRPQSERARPRATCCASAVVDHC